MSKEINPVVAISLVVVAIVVISLGGWLLVRRNSEANTAPAGYNGTLPPPKLPSGSSMSGRRISPTMSGDTLGRQGAGGSAGVQQVQPNDSKL